MFAAMLYPQVDDYVDLAKLPAAQTVSNTFRPRCFRESYNPTGRAACWSPWGSRHGYGKRDSWCWWAVPPRRSR